MRRSPRVERLEDRHVMATLISPAPSAVLSVPDRMDIVHDAKRDVVYISTTSGDVLRYDLAHESWLAPFEYPGRLVGMDLSPNQDKLAIADNTMSGVHVVDLNTGISQDYFITGSSSYSYTTAFKNDEALYVSTGSGIVELNLNTGVATSRAGYSSGSVLSLSADRSVLGYVKSGVSSGTMGKLNTSDNTGQSTSIPWFLFEIGTNRDGTQFAVPTYGGTYILNAQLQQLTVIGTYADEAPIGAAYNPVSDTVYFAWGGSTKNHTRIEAYDSKTLRRVQTIDAGRNFPFTGNAAFTNGRLEVATDGSLLFSSIPNGVAVYGLSSAPVLSGISGMSYLENAASVKFGGEAAVVDSDSANFAKGKLVVGITANAQADDRLEIANQGTGVGQIDVTGENVAFEGVMIGTFSGGAGGTPLTIQLNASATPAAVTALAQNITFRNTGHDPKSLARTVTFQLADGDGGISNPVDVTVEVTPVNDAPQIYLGGTASYRENAAAKVLAGGASFFDDASSFSGGTLTVTLTAGATADDRLVIVPQGTLPGKVGLSGMNVTFGGATIGTFTGGVGSEPLTVHFTAAASPTVVQSVVRAVGFQNVSHAPSTETRTVTFVARDSGGLSSKAIYATKQMEVQSVNDPPGLYLGGSTTYVEDSPAVLLAAGASLFDKDNTNLAGGVFTVRIASGAHASDRLVIQSQGTGPGQIGVSGSEITYGGVVVGTFGGGSGSVALTVTLNANATVAAAQAIIRKVAFETLGNTLSTAQRVITFQITDGSGGTSQLCQKLVNVTAVDDPPQITGDGTVGYTLGSAAILLLPTSTVTDPDGSTFVNGVLAVHSEGAADDDAIELSGPFSVDVNHQILLAGTIIGQMNPVGGTGKTDLTITFNEETNRAIVQLLLRSITFRASSQEGQRLIGFSLTDGYGKTSNTVVKTVGVVA